MSFERSASSFSTLRESNSVPEASSMWAQWDSLPASTPSHAFSMMTTPPSLAVGSLLSESTPPTAPYVANSPLRRSLLAVGASVGGEGQFFHSHLSWRGVLKPSSAPLCASSRICAWTTPIKVGRCSRKSVSRMLHGIPHRGGEMPFSPPGHRWGTTTCGGGE